MDRLALVSTIVFSLLLAINAALRSAPVAARKNYDPRLAAGVGFVAGTAAGIIAGIFTYSAVTDVPGLVGLGAFFGGYIIMLIVWHYVPSRSAQTDDVLPQDDALRQNIVARHVQGTIMRGLFFVSIVVALVSLATLIWTIANRTFGLTVVDYAIQPEALTLTSYELPEYLGDISADQARAALSENVRPVRLQELVLTQLGGMDQEDITLADHNQLLGAVVDEETSYDTALANTPLNELTPDQLVATLAANLDADELELLVYTEAGRSLQMLSDFELAAVLAEGISAERLRELILINVAGTPERELTGDELVWEVVTIHDYPQSIAQKPFNQLTQEDGAAIIMRNFSRGAAEDLALQEIGSRIFKEVRPLFRVQRPLENLNAEELSNALARNVSPERLQSLLLSEVARVGEADWPTVMTEPVGQVLADHSYPDALSFMRFERLGPFQAADLLMQNLDIDELRELVETEVGQATYEVGRLLEDIEADELSQILIDESRPARLRVLVLEIADIPQDEWASQSAEPVGSVLAGFEYTASVADTPLVDLMPEDAAAILASNLDQEAFQQIVFVEARNRLVDELPESDLAQLLADNVDVVKLHELIVTEVLLASNEDFPELKLEPVLSPRQAADVLARSLDRDTLERVTVEAAGPAILANMTDAELQAAFANNVLKETFIGIILTRIVEADPDTFRELTPLPVWQVMKGHGYADELGAEPFASLTSQQAADILRRTLPRVDDDEDYTGVVLEELVYTEMTARDLGELSKRELGSLLAVTVRKALMRRAVLSDVVKASESEFPELSGKPVGELLRGKDYPEQLADVSFSQVDEAQVADLLARNLNRSDLEEIVTSNVAQPQVVQSWTLADSLTKRGEIEDIQQMNYPLADLEWRSWLNWDFVNSAIDTRRADLTGIRPALLGSLLIIVIVIIVAFPIGVGAAIYLEEYAGKNALNTIIQTNINNLAGVPSIIYGILGLAIFVRAMEAVTSGNAFGTETANGRTVLTAGLTLSLLILPVIIINSQEAIRSVPSSLRQASYGLGATQWQTIWNHVLPYAMPGILTGTILAVSRAIGETAPLILVGGATYLTQDPDGPFAFFTALPLVIYRWTTLPQPEFRNAAAAAIVVLLAVLLTLNSIAVILRNRFSRRLT